MLRFISLQVFYFKPSQTDGYAKHSIGAKALDHSKHRQNDGKGPVSLLWIPHLYMSWGVLHHNWHKMGDGDGQEPIYPISSSAMLNCIVILKMTKQISLIMFAKWNKISVPRHPSHSNLQVFMRLSVIKLNILRMMKIHIIVFKILFNFMVSWNVGHSNSGVSLCQLPFETDDSNQNWRKVLEIIMQNHWNVKCRSWWPSNIMGSFFHTKLSDHTRKNENRT